MKVTVEEAGDSGIRSIEHLANFIVFTECSGGEVYNRDGCRQRFERLASEGVWETPTIAFFMVLADVFSGKPLPHSEYASDSLLELTRKNQKVSKLSENELAGLRSVSRNSLAAIHGLQDSGNRFLAGCDGLVPGFCLHDELKLLADAGLSPLEVLQTTTIGPAQFLGREKTDGSIETGKHADLVLLDADPLFDIQNTRRIVAVVMRGRLFSEDDIRRIIAGRRRAVQN